MKVAYTTRNSTKAHAVAMLLRDGEGIEGKIITSADGRRRLMVGDHVDPQVLHAAVQNAKEEVASFGL